MVHTLLDRAKVVKVRLARYTVHWAATATPVPGEAYNGETASESGITGTGVLFPSGGSGEQGGLAQSAVLTLDTPVAVSHSSQWGILHPMGARMSFLLRVFPSRNSEARYHGHDARRFFSVSRFHIDSAWRDSS